MNNIVVAFPKAEIAQNMKKILTQSGFPVIAVCTTGAQALQNVSNLESGILICGARFVDMMYEEIYSYLPKEFQMLLVASPGTFEHREITDIVSLSLPIKIHELIETVEMMDYSINRRRKKMRQRPKVRSEEEQQEIDRAKLLLMERNNLSEEEAHRYIQKRSMDNGTGLMETAQMILSLMGEG